MVNPNNPAGRLYLLLDDIRSQPQNASMQHAWAHALGANEADDGQLLVQVAEVVRLLQETKTLIGKQDVDQGLYLSPFIKIQRVFTLSFGHQAANAKEHLDPATMVGLEHCAELLSRKAGEEIVEATTLERLQADTDVLIERVMHTDLSANLKSLLLDSLHFVRQAILNYRIHGARGIEGAIKTTLGSIQYYTLHNRAEEPVNEEDKQAVRDFIGLLEQLLSIVANALNIPQLVSGITLRLLGP